ncbi:hypothetical protein GCM10027040_06540 [Halomonas shantousis]
MERKYKTRLPNVLFLSTAGLLMILGVMEAPSPTSLLLWAGAAIFACMALAKRPPHHLRYLTLVIALLVLGLLWLDPYRHGIWIWAWPILLLFPQPPLIQLSVAVLSVVAWWRMTYTLGLEQSLVLAVLLISLLLLGLANARSFMQLRHNIDIRPRVSPRMRMWSAGRLSHDLEIELARSEREGTYGELLLLRARTPQQLSAEELGLALNSATYPFESCYWLNGTVFAVILITRDIQSARLRRNAIIEQLPGEIVARVMPLEEPTPPILLAQELAQQQEPLRIDMEAST